MTGETSVGLSQSGRTPDVVDYLERARANGALTIALTNDPSSELARHGRRRRAAVRGDEQAVAATKTYLTTVAALALLAGHLAGRGAELSDGDPRGRARRGASIPELERTTASSRCPVRVHGPHVRHRPRRRVRDRARDRTEAARDLYVAAEPLTSTDLAHGPSQPSTRCSPSGRSPPATDAAHRAGSRLRVIRAMGATLVASGTAAERVKGAAYTLPVPTPRSATPLPPALRRPGAALRVGTGARARARSGRPHGLARSRSPDSAPPSTSADAPSRAHARVPVRSRAPVPSCAALRTRSRNDSIGKPGPGSQWSLRSNARLTST